jgi:hypothetical protein
MQMGKAPDTEHFVIQVEVEVRYYEAKTDVGDDGFCCGRESPAFARRVHRVFLTPEEYHQNREEAVTTAIAAATASVPMI